MPGDRRVFVGAAHVSADGAEFILGPRSADPGANRPHGL
jgi:hypothetical protein